MADNGIPIGFVELDPEEVQKALDGQEYVLGDEQTKAEALYRQHKYCPNGCGPTMEKHAGTVEFAFSSDEWSIPRCLMKCHVCGCTRNPFDGMIVEIGDRNKSVYGDIPIIDPQEH